MPDKRIPELDPLVLVDGSILIPGYDAATDTTYRIKLSDVVPGMSTASINWQPSPAVYNTDDIVASEGRLWASNINGNEDVPPYEGVEWREVAKSKSGLAIYMPGVFTDDDVYTVSNYSGSYNIYRLINPTRPFISTDLATEVTGGDWEAFGGGGGASYTFTSGLTEVAGVVTLGDGGLVYTFTPMAGVNLKVGNITAPGYVVLEYPINSGSAFLGASGVSNHFGFGLNAQGQYGGTPNTDSGRCLYFFDYFTGQYVGGFGPDHTFYIGASNGSYSFAVDQSGHGRFTTDLTINNLAGVGARVTYSDTSGTLQQLGSPGTSGYILSSTAAGVLSWIAPPSGSSYTFSNGLVNTGGSVTWNGPLNTSTYIEGSNVYDMTLGTTASQLLSLDIYVAAQFTATSTFTANDYANYYMGYYGPAIHRFVGKRLQTGITSTNTVNFSNSNPSNNFFQVDLTRQGSGVNGRAQLSLNQSNVGSNLQAFVRNDAGTATVQMDMICNTTFPNGTFSVTLPGAVSFGITSTSFVSSVFIETTSNQGFVTKDTVTAARQRITVASGAIVVAPA